MKKYIAEALGTFALVFCGTGSIVINDISNGAVTHLGIATSFGLVVMIMIYALGSISGAHMNPAVTLAFSLTDRFDSKQILRYIFFQAIGGILASLALHFLFTEHQGLGATQPFGSWQQTFILEAILTYFLMFVILFVSQNKSTAPYTAIAVGGTVLLEALFAGPISGASMNPIRSIAPALVSGKLNNLWIYIIAPILGAVLATYTWKYLKIENS